MELGGRVHTRKDHQKLLREKGGGPTGVPCKSLKTARGRPDEKRAKTDFSASTLSSDRDVSKQGVIQGRMRNGRSAEEEKTGALV